MVALLLGSLTACARAPELIGIDNAAMPVASVEQAKKRKIYIATTRQASQVPGAFFSGRRAAELGLASVTVSVPPIHKPGELERPKVLPPDPKTEFAVIDPTIYATDRSFVSSINRSLARLSPMDRNILVFVHGYNNTLSDSVLRLAQFVEDTGFDGVPVLFSWASAAKPSQYVYDLNSALAARPRLAEAADIMGRTNARGFNLVAHSMGAFLTMEAIVQAELRGGFNRSGRLRNIMLAAPDIDIDLFRAQLSQIPEKDRVFFIFVSKDDSALGFARTISGGVNRVGAADATELEEFGVTVIDLSAVDDSSSGSHSKFAGSPEVVQLIGQGLQSSSRFGAPSQNQLEELLAGVPIRILGN